MWIRRVAPCLAGLVAVLAAAGLGARSGDEAWELGVPAPRLSRHTERLEDIEGLACAECHAEVVEEWRGSLHAVAWVDEVYRRDLRGKRKPEACWGCHAPVRMHAGEPPARMHAGEPMEKPEPRDELRHLGISCESCHVDGEGTVLGPWGLETEAHPSRRHESFVGVGSNGLCIACHRTNIGPVIGIARDFIESGQEEAGHSCVGCHMAPVERVLEAAPGAAEERRTGRSHALQTPRDPGFMRRAFGLSARRAGDGAVLAVENRAAHRVPGLNERVIVLSVEGLDAAGAVRERGRMEIDYRAYLAVGAPRELRLEGNFASLRVRGVHFDPRLGEDVEFLDEVLPLPPEGTR